MSNYRHGQKPSGGASPEYVCWINMLSRCSNPKDPRYARYGGRGIKVSRKWRNSFLAFLADMGARPSTAHSIERKNNDGNYTRSNCRWATRTEQARNRTSTRLIEMGGETKSISEWCQLYGIDRRTVKQREIYGWDIKKALTTPVRGHSYNEELSVA